MLRLLRRSSKFGRVHSLDPCRPLNQFADRPYLVRQPARHRWRLSLQRFVLAAEVVPREENRLHGDVVLVALAVGIGQPREPAQLFIRTREVEPLDMRRAYPVIRRGSPNRSAAFQCCLSWPASSASSLGCCVGLYQLREVNLHSERERNVHRVGCRPSVVSWKRPLPIALFQLQQKRPARIRYRAGRPGAPGSVSCRARFR